MERMGYVNQPYIVFKHTDIERTHIHIVTVCVGLDGKKLPDSYDHPRSMAICRDLEQTYNPIPATEKQRTGNEQVFRPVDYRAGDVKSQMASVVRHLPKYYGVRKPRCVQCLAFAFQYYGRGSQRGTARTA